MLISPAKARQLLKERLAKEARRTTFTIQPTMATAKTALGLRIGVDVRRRSAHLALLKKAGSI